MTISRDLHRDQNWPETNLNMILPKGYTVKHGTSLGRLEGILKDGLLPTYKRNIARLEEEAAPIVHGVYVANNLSYYGASLAFTSFMHEKIKTQESCGEVPIVLEFELGDDCLLAADEDYVQKSNEQETDQILSELLEEAERVWSKYESGVIVDRIIPVEWIRKIEYPILRDAPSISISRKHWTCLEQDINLLVLAYWQYKTNATVSEFNEMLYDFKKTHRYSAHFTNVTDFSEDSVAKLRSLNVVKDEKKLFEYANALWYEYTKRLDNLGLQYRSPKSA